MFRTDLERLTTFQAIRKTGELPAQIYTDFPEYSDVLKTMLSEDPSKRPSAKELLELPIFTARSKKELLQTIDDQEKKVVFLGVIRCRFGS